MAGVNWQKLKSPQDIKRQLRHCDKECRQKDNHANEHINKDLTKYNLQTCDYATACKRFDDRIAYLDSLPKQNHKDGRVLAFGLDIPIPDGIPNSELRNFAIKVNEIIKNTTGINAEDIVAIHVHIDEVHDYIDSNTKQERTSMRHIHKYVIPNINDKLNGKAFSSRKNMIAVNNAIEKMCMEDYGVHFLTGEKTKSTESVESLKLKSKALELDERENLVEQREESVAQQEIDVEARERAVAQRESEADVIYKSAYKKREEAEEKLSEANKLMEEAKRREQSARQAENAAVIQTAALQNRADELEAAKNEFKEREQNFNAEVRKAAEKMLERQKQATLTIKEFENHKKQAERIANLPFANNDEE